MLDDKNQTQIVKPLAALETASQRAGQLALALEPGAKGVPALTADARKMMVNADAALRDVIPVLQEAKTSLAGIDKLAREYAQRANALDRVANSAEQMGAASQGAASAVSSDLAPRMNALLEALARNSRNLDRLLSDLNEQPQGLVFGRASGRPGPGETGFIEPQKSK